MKFYKDSNSYDWTGHVCADNYNTKVGDSVKVVYEGFPRLRVSDGVVTKMTSTTMHVKHESCYPDHAKGTWHFYETTTIFRKHSFYGDKTRISFENGRTTVYKVC